MEVAKAKVLPQRKREKDRERRQWAVGDIDG
jgi:hypothetical protein